MVRYNLVGIDGNAFSVMGYVTRAMREQKFTREEIDTYMADAKSSDYNHLLVCSMDMVDQCNERTGCYDNGDDYEWDGDDDDWGDDDY